MYGGGGVSVSSLWLRKGEAISCISGAFDILVGEGGGERRKFGFWRERRGRIGERGAQKCEEDFSEKEDAK